MRNVQPEMRLEGQVRKGTEQVAKACLGANFEKARYILSLIQKMCDAYRNGVPEPWSNFEPMIEEEFS